MAVTVNQMKHALRLDTDEDNDYLAVLIEAAQERIIHSVDTSKSLADYQQYKIFDIAVMMVVAEWYFNRTNLMDSKNVEIPNGDTSIIVSLIGIMVGGDDDATD
ncbi:head-tail connector protein [Sporolactobacillus shoreicorticis]|uniref:Head-tail connector protein n=1 Tax=Sporolactobacillus shoreicorticis TaxID=1923877 RepID=A0ABW5S9D8_9BACL|nr:head-tail connector protein [Sporolactobacillus shoreicorticis]MCO7126635.1 head-tail connector protein [Sporolactobacillus shoreicorticis]